MRLEYFEEKASCPPQLSALIDERISSRARLQHAPTRDKQLSTDEI
jgi:hypothetical protein